ncbi:MAG TPA: Wzy polymerase domain-containing protein, partial [Caldimonas sp.]
LALMIYALWQALRNAVADGRAPATVYPAQRAAFVIVFLVAVHSMLEYPLWYSYFLLPTAFAFGLCLERPAQGEGAVLAARDDRGSVTRPYVLAAMFLILAGTLAVYDYMRVVVIFAPPANAGSLEQRIAAGRTSVLFGHHADYAAATIAEHPGEVMEAFKRAPHYLLDTRLMTAWARALAERGETDKARWIADRLREFRNEADEELFAPCSSPSASRARATAPVASGPGSAASAPPFQCRPAERTYRFEDFR